MEMKPVPELYKNYPFFDDGKYSPSRMSVATVVRIMTIEEAKNHIIFLRDIIDPNNKFKCETKSLYDIWKEAVESTKSDNVYPNKDGYWCYAPETDYFIVCAIPTYDDSLIYFSRHVNGGWFSFETGHSWMSGRLDIDCLTFKNFKDDYPEFYNEFKGNFNLE